MIQQISRMLVRAERWRELTVHLHAHGEAAKYPSLFDDVKRAVGQEWATVACVAAWLDREDDIAKIESKTVQAATRSSLELNLTRFSTRDYEPEWRRWYEAAGLPLPEPSWDTPVLSDAIRAVLHQL